MFMIFKGILSRLAVVCMVFFSLSALAQYDKPAALPKSPPGTAIATFGAGCFWCTEQFLDEVPGVLFTTSGYMGGRTKNPTYNQVSTGGTGHNEVVQIVYDPKKVSYEKLLDAFWHNIDPTQFNGQFCDHGTQYRSEIFYHDEDQRKAALASKAALEKSRPFKGEIRTLITPAAEFYPAEEYHQDYYKKNPLRYNYYKTSCGRKSRLDELWKQH